MAKLKRYNGTSWEEIALDYAKKVKLNGTEYSPDSSGVVDLGTVSGGDSNLIAYLNQYANDFYNPTSVSNKLASSVDGGWVATGSTSLDELGVSTAAELMAKTRSFIGTISTDEGTKSLNTFGGTVGWWDAIICKHRNGAGDGASYGMMLSTCLTDNSGNNGRLRFTKYYSGGISKQAYLLDDTDPPQGFHNVASPGWGTLGGDSSYTKITAWEYNGGSIGFFEKNGQLSMQVDGDIYVQEGQRKLAPIYSDVSSTFGPFSQSSSSWMILAEDGEYITLGGGGYGRWYILHAKPSYSTGGIGVTRSASTNFGSACIAVSMSGDSGRYVCLTVFVPPNTIYYVEACYVTEIYIKCFSNDGGYF